MGQKHTQQIWEGTRSDNAGFPDEDRSKAVA